MTQDKGTAACLAIGTIAALAMSTNGWCNTDAASEDLPSARLIAELGLTPEALALASLDADDSLAIFLKCTELSDGVTTLNESRHMLDLTVASLSESRRDLELDPGNIAAAKAIDTLEPALEQQQQFYELAQRSLRDGVLGAVDNESAKVIKAAITLERFRIPPECRVVECSDDEAHTLQSAWLAVRRAERLGKEPPPEALALTQAVLNDPDVVAAKGALSQNLASIEAVFDLLDE